MKVQGIPSVAAAYATPSNARTHGISADNAEPASLTADTYTGAQAERCKGIVSKYNLRSMSRTEVAAMTKELFEAGVIDGAQALDLSAPYQDTFDKQMRITTDADAKTDYLSGLTQILDNLKRTAPEDKRSIAYMQRVVDLSQSLAAIAEQG